MKLTPAMKRALLENVDTCGSPKKWGVGSQTIGRLSALGLVYPVSPGLEWRPTSRTSWRMTDKGRALAEKLRGET